MTSFLEPFPTFADLANQRLSGASGNSSGLIIDREVLQRSSANAKSEASVSSAGSRSWSTASGDDEASGARYQWFQNPVSMMDELLSKQVSVTDASQIVLGYLKCCSAESAPDGAMLSSVASSRSSKRRARRRAYRVTCESMSRQDGMCYLSAIHWSRRARFAGKLGARPTVYDLVATLECADLDRVAMHHCKVVCVSSKPGAYVYHVKPEAGQEDNVVGTFAQVLVALYESYPRSFSFDASFGSTSEVEVIPLTAVVGAEGSIVPEATSGSIRGYCSVCDCNVKLEGHESRCAPVVVSADRVELQRKAWLGDAIHRMDVRKYLLLAGTPDANRGLAEQRLVERGAQALWHFNYKGPKEKPLGSSDHSKSTAFEASYKGIFRHDYIASVLKLPSDVSVSDSLEGFVFELSGGYKPLGAQLITPSHSVFFLELPMTTLDDAPKANVLLSEFPTVDVHLDFEVTEGHVVWVLSDTWFQLVEGVSFEPSIWDYGATRSVLIKKPDKYALTLKMADVESGVALVSMPTDGGVSTLITSILHGCGVWVGTAEQIMLWPDGSPQVMWADIFSNKYRFPRPSEEVRRSPLMRKLARFSCDWESYSYLALVARHQVLEASCMQIPVSCGDLLERGFELFAYDYDDDAIMYRALGCELVLSASNSGFPLVDSFALHEHLDSIFNMFV